MAASAAFAGEREAGTLNLLDALPVSRGTLWLGKTTFVLVSTFGLSLVLLALGYLGSIQAWGKLPTLAEFVGQYGTLLFEAVAWGLLWSALVRNPMVAAALALACVGEVSYLASGGTKIEFISDTVIPARLLMAALALGASAVVIVGTRSRDGQHRGGWRGRGPLDRRPGASDPAAAGLAREGFELEGET